MPLVGHGDVHYRVSPAASYGNWENYWDFANRCMRRQPFSVVFQETQGLSSISWQKRNWRSQRKNWRATEFTGDRPSFFGLTKWHAIMCNPSGRHGCLAAVHRTRTSFEPSGRFWKTHLRPRKRSMTRAAVRVCSVGLTVVKRPRPANAIGKEADRLDRGRRRRASSYSLQFAGLSSVPSRRCHPAPTTPTWTNLRIGARFQRNLTPTEYPARSSKTGPYSFLFLVVTERSLDHNNGARRCIPINSKRVSVTAFAARSRELTP